LADVIDMVRHLRHRGARRRVGSFHFFRPVLDRVRVVQELCLELRLLRGFQLGVAATSAESKPGTNVP